MTTLMDFLNQLGALLSALYTFITTNPAGVGAAIGSVLPVLVSVIARPEWSNRQRTYLAIGLSIVLGTAVTLSNASLDGPGDYLTTLAALYFACETFYQKLYKGTGLATAIEAATSPKPMPGTVSEPELVPAATRQRSRAIWDEAGRTLGGDAPSEDSEHERE